MAVKKKTTEEIQDQTEPQVAAEQAAGTPEQEEVHGKAEEPEVQEAAFDPEEDVEAAAPELESLSVLADRHRVVGWQQAALLRFMNWMDDKRVSDVAYRAALENLKSRRIGGGRKE